MGVDLVEADVRQTRDGQLIILHDAVLQGSTTGSGFVHEKTLDEIQRLRTKPGGEPIPTLAQVLAAVNGHAGLMLEIKAPGTAENVYRAVGAAGFAGPVLYASFRHAELLRVRALDASAMTIALIEGAPVRPAAFALEAEATFAGVGMDSLSAEFVRALHEAGVGVLAWTADEPEEIAWARACAVDGIISNYPDRLGPVAGSR